MTAPLAVSQHPQRSVGSPFAIEHGDTVRAQLLAEAESHASTLARCTAAMVTHSPENTTDLGRATNALRMYVAREALEEIEAALARLDALPLESQARRPSSTVTGTADAVRRVVVLANRLLREDPGQHSVMPSSELTPRLHRVARLRDELHVTSNRIARFGDDEHPLLDPVRIMAPLASSAVLAPAHLLVQLDLAAGRLVGHLYALTAADWRRTGRMGDRLVTLGDLVDDVVHAGTHDLLDLLHAAPLFARKEPRDATAS
jgi:hypothetical protein